MANKNKNIVGPSAGQAQSHLHFQPPLRLHSTSGHPLPSAPNESALCQICQDQNTKVKKHGAGRRAQGVGGIYGAMTKDPAFETGDDWWDDWGCVYINIYIVCGCEYVWIDRRERWCKRRLWFGCLTLFRACSKFPKASEPKATMVSMPSFDIQQKTTTHSRIIPNQGDKKD